MYVPDHFAMPPEQVQELLQHAGAGDLVTHTAEAGLLATLLPFVYDGSAGTHGSLHGHVARNNDQWRQAATGEALVLLRGPDAYVSPSWYATKAEHGRVVPTWNYVALHVYGRLVVHDDVDYVRRVVHALTTKHEAALAHPWAVTDAPAGFVEGQLRAIVGVEVQITRVEAKAKLSQNRSSADVAGVVQGLRQRGAAVMADEVQRRAET